MVSTGNVVGVHFVQCTPHWEPLWCLYDGGARWFLDHFHEELQNVRLRQLVVDNHFRNAYPLRDIATPTLPDLSLPHVPAEPLAHLQRGYELRCFFHGFRHRDVGLLFGHFHVSHSQRGASAEPIRCHLTHPADVFICPRHGSDDGSRPFHHLYDAPANDILHQRNENEKEPVAAPVANGRPPILHCGHGHIEWYQDTDSKPFHQWQKNFPPQIYFTRNRAARRHAHWNPTVAVLCA